MSDDELDLETGDPDRAEQIAARQEDGQKRRRRIKGEPTAGSKGGTSERTRARAASQQRVADGTLGNRLNEVFGRIAEALDARGDDELASVIREDSASMSQGLVSLTRSLTFLRFPLLTLLNFVEPVLAFGRVGRILVTRFFDRRARRAEEARLATLDESPLQVQPEPVFQ